MIGPLGIPRPRRPPGRLAVRASGAQRWYSRTEAGPQAPVVLDMACAAFCRVGGHRGLARRLSVMTAVVQCDPPARWRSRSCAGRKPMRRLARPTTLLRTLSGMVGGRVPRWPSLVGDRAADSAGVVADRKKKKATRSTGPLPGQQRRHDHHAEDEHSQAHRTGSRAPTVAASTVLTSTPGVYAGLCRRRRNCHLSPSASSALVRIHRKSLALTTGGCLTGISPMTPGVHPRLRQATAVVHSLSAGLPGRRLG